MSTITKHKPATLDENRGPCARKDLYGPGRWTGDRYQGWEGIDAAKSRQRELSTSIKTAMENIRTRFGHLSEAKPIETLKRINKVRRLIGQTIPMQVKYSAVLQELTRYEQQLGSQ